VGLPQDFQFTLVNSGGSPNFSLGLLGRVFKAMIRPFVKQGDYTAQPFLLVSSPEKFFKGLVATGWERY